MGHQALNTDFDTLVINNCELGVIVQLGPIGCSMAKKMIKAGQSTVISPEEPEL
mgnify:FL=1